MESSTRLAAQRTLSAAFGGSVLLGDEERLGGSDRSKAGRFRIRDGPSAAPASVIVKRAAPAKDQRYDPSDPTGPAGRLFDEWAGLEFLDGLADRTGAGLTPRLYAGDRETGLIVLEDLGAGLTLADLLLGSDSVIAEGTLIAYAAALGSLHALTAGRRDEHARLRESLGPRALLATSTAAEAAIGPERLADAFRAAIAAVGIAATPSIDADLAALARFQAEPGPFSAFVHNDPCPDNCLVADRGVRLLDFEFGGFGHALVDGVYGRIHFPTCWCVNRLPTSLPLRMEGAYRAELAKGCPAATDDRLFSRAVVEACAYWTAGMLHWAIPVVLRRDENWGIATWRQRVLLRLGVLAQAAEEAGHLEALGATARALMVSLSARWPREASELPYFPAFRGEGMYAARPDRST